ncbi:PREDICTED: tetraspanin-16 [Elephantulus edwardii]|uniref:tetraspanin-16 n=1 Tax=Elephantulus edwardii TaxID=28737 RepID=UPI0003F0C5D7|nr:PREDICTED: tetraspanin-16 [Elephantulus edwardii]
MGEAHTSYSSLKKLLLFLNGSVVVSGVLLIGLSSCVNKNVELTRALGLSATYLLHFGCLCSVMGCITVLLGVAGWYGAAKESRRALLFCFLSLSIIVFMEITVATAILTFFPIVQSMAFEHVLETLKTNYREDKPDEYSLEWSSAMTKVIGVPTLPAAIGISGMQTSLTCCGVRNYTDFSGSSFETATGLAYPQSCCKASMRVLCDGRNVSAAIIHQKGCFPKLMRITKMQSHILSGGSLGAMAIQLTSLPCIDWGDES